jgi:sugar phosphate isomerase/epimerase
MFKLALHSVSYGGLWGQTRLTLEQFIPKAAKLGYTGVELMAKRPHLSLLDATPAGRRDWKAVAEGHGIRIVALAGYNDFAAGNDVPDVPLREMQAYYLGELARLAADLGCPLVRVFTSYERPGLAYQATWEQTVSGLRDAARRAADHGVTLGVQNHHDLAVHHDSLLDMIEEIDMPNVKVCFDAWAPALQGEDVGAAAKKLAAMNVHTTVADYVRRPRYRYDPALVNYSALADAVRAVPMGHGFIDYRSFFAALKETGFDGYVTYEMCSPLKGGGSEENLDRCAAAFIRYMKELPDSSKKSR